MSNASTARAYIEYLESALAACRNIASDSDLSVSRVRQKIDDVVLAASESALRLRYWKEETDFKVGNEAKAMLRAHIAKEIEESRVPRDGVAAMLAYWVVWLLENRDDPEVRTELEK